MNAIVAELKELASKKAHMVEQLVAELSCKDIPLLDRWELYTKSYQDLDYDDWTDSDVTRFGDFDFTRYQQEEYIYLVESQYTPEEEDNGDADELKEYILSTGLAGFTHDW